MNTLLLALLLSSELATAQPADRVVAVVEEELVLASEIALSQALTERDVDASPFWTQRRRHEVDRLIDAAMVRASASEVGLYTPSDAEVTLRLQRLRDTFSDEGAADTFFAAWGLSSDDQRAWARRRLTVERYINRNLRVSVDDPTWTDELQQLLQGLQDTSRVRRIEAQR